MTLVTLIGLVMGFVLMARFLKILDRAVEWLYIRYIPQEEEDQEEEDPDDKGPEVKIPKIKTVKKKRIS